MLLPDEETDSASRNAVSKLQIACPPFSARASIISEDEKALIAKLLTSFTGQSVQIEFVASSSLPDMSTTTDPKSLQKTTPMMLQYEAERDAQLAPVLNLFEAKILKIEPK